MARGQKPDIAGLRAFIDEGDRSRARFFVGREGQIRDVRGICALARGGNPAGVTRVIQGAPGAGKTALLSRMKELWTGPDDPYVVSCTIGVVADPATLVGAIVDAAAPHLAEEYRSSVSAEMGGGINLLGLTVGWRRSKGRAPPPADPWAWLLRRQPRDRWKRPLCLMVDEIQALERSQTGTLRDLHLGATGLPIVPVLAGLAHSRDVLAACGISRLSSGAVHTLGALRTGEPRQAVRQMLEQFGVDVTGADPDRWAGLIEARSDYWPQHLQNGMHALAEGLIAADGVLARVDEAAVTAREQQGRSDSYAARLSDGMKRSRLLLAGVMDELGYDGLSRDEVIDAVNTTARSDDAVGWHLPPHMDADAFVHHLIAQGALQPDVDDRLVCPIPNFRRYLIKRGQQTPAAAGGKILGHGDLAGQLSRWRAHGLRIGFASGCFDILHPGHVALLEQARETCDRLVVGLQADAAVARLKGPDRPVRDEAARATLLAHQRAVSAVVTFDDDTPAALIEEIRPDVLATGGNGTDGTVAGAEIVESYGGRLLLVDRVAVESTAVLAEQLRRGRT